MPTPLDLNPAFRQFARVCAEAMVYEYATNPQDTGYLEARLLLELLDETEADPS